MYVHWWDEVAGHNTMAAARLKAGQSWVAVSGWQEGSASCFVRNAEFQGGAMHCQLLNPACTACVAELIAKPVGWVDAQRRHRVLQPGTGWQPGGRDRRK